MSNIIKQINDLASLLSEQDLDEWIVPKLIEHYTPKLNSLAAKAYGSAGECSQLARMAFKERSKSELRAALYTFIFKAEHWRTGRDVNTYLLKSLSRLADRIKWDSDSVKKVNALVCPGCKFLKKREFVIAFGDMWKCQECSGELERAQEDIKKLKNTDLDFAVMLEGRLRLFRSFATHSRRGYRCPDCGRFIPESCNGEHGICCPYINCMFSGSIEDMERMAHPVGLTRRLELSLQTPIDNDQKGPEIQDTFMSDDIDPDIHIEMNEMMHIELSTLQQVIAEQLKAVKRTNSPGTMLQKCLMYEAYSNMLIEYPEDMVSYLVHQKQTAEYPIQSRIFQEYVRLIQDALPYTIEKSDGPHEVVSLLDPNISLFEGVSMFNAVVRSDNTIPNNTTETYTGGRKFKCYGPCFIGLVIDVVDRRNDKSLREHVQDYSFVQVKMSQEIDPGTPVTVRHYRMPSHYEMGSLTYLQRIRKRIVDKVYFKMHGMKREPRCA